MNRPEHLTVPTELTIDGEAVAGAGTVLEVYDPATERGIAWDDPEVGVDWRVEEPLLSARDKDAPHLSQIADSLPW